MWGQLLGRKGQEKWWPQFWQKAQWSLVTRLNGFPSFIHMLIFNHNSRAILMPLFNHNKKHFCFLLFTDNWLNSGHKIKFTSWQSCLLGLSLQHILLSAQNNFSTWDGKCYFFQNVNIDKRSDWIAMKKQIKATFDNNFYDKLRTFEAFIVSSHLCHLFLY